MQDPGATSEVAISRTDRWTVGVLLFGIALSWLIVLVGPDGMGVGPVLFVIAWTIMMIAMMMPSAAPLVLLYRRGASTRDTAALVAGYMAVWAATGIPAYFASMWTPMWLSTVALGAAGVYQLTPLKQSCLQHCRSPADFLMHRWGRGAFRLGLDHGAWCLGCCWALMAVLVLVGMMGLAWVAGIAALVAVEKISRHGVIVSRLAGIAMIAAALIRMIP